MKLITVSLLVLGGIICCSVPSKGQSPQPVKKDSIVYGPKVYVERMPFLPGGERLSNERRRFQIIAAVQANLVLPSGFKRPKKSAKAYVSFEITPNAQVTDVRIIKIDDKLNQDCATAAVVAVQRLSGFTPGFEKGHPVLISITVPVEFGLGQ